MSFFEFNATKVWFTDTEIKVQLVDGRVSGLPIDNFPMLKNAKLIERENVEIINGYALYWSSLGEDLSVAGFFEKETV